MIKFNGEFLISCNMIDGSTEKGDFETSRTNLIYIYKKFTVQYIPF